MCSHSISLRRCPPPSLPHKLASGQARLRSVWLPSQRILARQQLAGGHRAWWACWVFSKSNDMLSIEPDKTRPAVRRFRSELATVYAFAYEQGMH